MALHVISPVRRNSVAFGAEVDIRRQARPPGSVENDPQRSSVVQPATRAQNINVLIRLGDEHAIGDTVFGVDQLA
jgi:hypothetical protein